MKLNLGENALLRSREGIFVLTPFALSEKKREGGGIQHGSKCSTVLFWEQHLDVVSARPSLFIAIIFTTVTSTSHLKVWTSAASRRAEATTQ